MYAIINTFDRQTGFAKLLYLKYKELWPTCPFTFRIPYNTESCPELAFFRACKDVELVKCQKPIKIGVKIVWYTYVLKE